ncbi:hypothetical protein HNR23_001723 [Nocardiopsis mwathae]|uniref:Uncharacterized protein n=1 Tax=Nocardiopsis mwathae TaxID=1472723 RepID=A0A7X0D4X9_9ACTN|nr:hypothetical protein [Nocardiopsis mwathae]MBB6171663.1 hypothetical protein [Nocardiopsis mwathae]
MASMRTGEALTLAALQTWAQYHEVAIERVESWDVVVHRAEEVRADGTRHRRLYRETFPPVIAIKRRANTFTVEAVHEPAGAQCFHVRVITPRLSGGELVDPGYLAELVAVARIQRKCRARCGATAENLRVLTTERTYSAHRPSDWKG